MTKLGEGVEVRAHTLPNDGPPHEPGLIPVALHQALQVDGDIVRPGQLAVLLPPPIQYTYSVIKPHRNIFLCYIVLETVNMTSRDFMIN